MKNSDLIGLFRQASRLMKRQFHRHNGAHHAQARVLSIIVKRGSISQGELLEILDVRSSSLSELLRKLEDNGMVVRERNEDDRRSFVILPTDAARERFAEHKKEVENTNIFDCLDETERQQLGVIMLKLVDSLKDDDCMGDCQRDGRGKDCRLGRGRRHGQREGMGHGLGRGRGK
jgi:DNA-binding MarR family transcriptional regulator